MASATMVSDAFYLGIALVLIGAVLLIMEFVHPGLFVVIPGTIVLLAGILLLIFGSFNILSTVGGPFIVVGVVILAGVFAILFYSRLAPTHPPIASTFETLTNYPGEVTVTVEPGNMHGKVRVRGEVWSARSEFPIPVGSQVRVLGGEGVTLHVEPVSTPPAGGKGRSGGPNSSGTS